MTKNPHFYRPALTAIAAVLASSPLAVAAQTAPSDTSAPPTMTPPIATPTAQPVIAIDPVAPQAKPVTPRSTIAPAALRQIVDQAITDATQTPVAETRSNRAATTAVPRTNTAPRSAPTAAPSVAPAADALAPPATIDPPAARMASEEIAATPAAVNRPAVSINDNALVTGGLIGFGLLGLGGLAFAMRRRSRAAPRIEQRREPERRVEAVPQPAVYGGAAPVAPVTVAPLTASAFAPALARSGGGSHVEQAMRGPTPDNPFLTLRKRLARARFLDKREQTSGRGRSGFGGLQPALA